MMTATTISTRLMPRWIASPSRVVVVAILSQMASQPASAANTTRLWNLTANTITSLSLAPAGTQAFGDDKAKNDKDGSVDHDERLRITGVSTGLYDVRFSDAKGRTCLVRNVAIKQGDVFSIEESQLKDCTK